MIPSSFTPPSHNFSKLKGPSAWTCVTSHLPETVSYCHLVVIESNNSFNHWFSQICVNNVNILKVSTIRELAVIAEHHLSWCASCQSTMQVWACWGQWKASASKKWKEFLTPTSLAWFEWSRKWCQTWRRGVQDTSWSWAALWVSKVWAVNKSYMPKVSVSSNGI